MFLGHALLAFAVVTSVAARRVDPRRALLLGAFAGAFATAPDVDMAYALVGVLTADASTPLGLAASFWSTGSVVHRGVTHSLVVALPVALAAGAWAAPRRPVRLVGLAIAGGLVVVATSVSGLLGGIVMALFTATVLVVAAVAARERIAARTVGILALVGVATHPFGDLFTGEPPALLYPLDAVVVESRVVLDADPTVHLLTAFGLELATIWVAVAVALAVVGVRPRVAPRAALAAGYATTVLLIPAPTLDLSYPFVFSVLAVGMLGPLPRVSLSLPVSRPELRLPTGSTALLTGLTAVTVAWAAYTLAYLVV